MAVRVVAFDVNETLLDLRALDEPFEELFGDAGLRPQWFAQMLQLAFVGGLTGQYVDFGTAQLGALRALAEREGVHLAPGAAESVVERMSTLPPHPEVVEALERLGATPLVAVALTNSTQAVAEAQLRNAGLDRLLTRALSADSVRALKPAPEPYRHVARQCGVEIGEVRLVAAHGWDVAGALAAGCRAAFVARPGAMLSPLGPRPDLVGRDLAEVVDLVIDADVP